MSRLLERCAQILECRKPESDLLAIPRRSFPFLENDAAASTQLKQEVGDVLAEAVGEEIWESIHGRDFRRIASITAAVSVHSHWLPVENELAKVSQQVAADATGRAGAIIDRLAAIQKDDDKSAIQRSLAAAEQDFRTVTQEIDPIFRALAQPMLWIGRQRHLSFKNCRSRISIASMTMTKHLD